MWVRAASNLMKLHALMTSLRSKDTVLIISYRSTSTHQKWIDDNNKKKNILHSSKVFCPLENNRNKTCLGSYCYLYIYTEFKDLYFKLDTQLFTHSSQYNQAATKRGVFIYIFNSSILSESI